MRQIIRATLLTVVTLTTAFPLEPRQADYKTWAKTAVDTLVSLHDSSDGLWQKQWWQSANSLTAVADYHAVDSSFGSTAQEIYKSTFKNAQTTSDSAFGKPLPGFRDMFYDDMGWWALAWTRVYDVTSNDTYLSMAESIFEAQNNGISNQCKGGIYWNTDKQSINAISTELYISTAAHLANRVPSKKQHYVDLAMTQWNWLVSSGMFNSAGSIQDHINASTCAVGGDVWSYNQGVIMGGLAQLHIATGDNSHITEANHLATVFIDNHNKGGIIGEWCDPGCENDTVAIFKGVFVRALAAVLKAQTSPPQALHDSLLSNAQAVWNNARTSAGFKPLWTPNNSASATYDGTTAAVDALVAAAVIA